jgi:hypothetical protein
MTYIAQYYLHTISYTLMQVRNKLEGEGDNPVLGLFRGFVQVLGLQGYWEFKALVHWKTVESDFGKGDRSN